MAEPEVTVAVVALVISLVALVVTTQQLLVQIFGSADGYRQCAESVIGSWHQRRKRIWKWSEFRFETQYVTPQIALLTSAEFLDMFEEYDEVCTINGASAQRRRWKGSTVKVVQDFNPKELIDTVHGRYGQARIRSRPHAWNIPTWNLGKRRPGHEVEKGSPPSNTESRDRIGRRNDTSVTWLRLLGELHSLSNAYWPGDCATCSVDFDRNSPIPETAIETGINRQRLYKGNDGCDGRRTMPCVVYRTWNWGFMPPDLTRPLAEISLGDIVVLALRMGMQWRVLDLESGKMQADGNGFNLTGFEARGLGIILRFTATEKHNQYRKIIPTRAADKMLFGILPGDPDLVKMDFPLIKKDFSVQSFMDPQGVLAAIMSRKNLEKLGDVDQFVRTDVMTLLATYLPIEDCLMTCYCFPGWTSHDSNVSVYTFWEGRLALHRALAERAKLPSRPHQTARLNQVLQKFDVLEREYKDDWYVRWSKPRVMRNERGVQAKQKCMADLRTIYQWTQAWLKEHISQPGQLYGPTYTDLVAAHAYMATHAYRATKYRDPADTVNHGPDGKYILMIPEYDETIHGFRPDDTVYAIACNYVEHLHNDEHGFGAYLRYNELEMSSEDCEAAWWVMQLRGIVWHLSTWHGDSIVRDVLGEQLIPSSFYGNKSPIWIT